ncbi:hypothetical protein ALC62_15750, partial [Cyphomyrmex costatus]
WTTESTLALINLVEEYEEQFQSSVKKYVWQKISEILKDKLSISFTWQQCDTKWKGLLKIYKDVKEHNITSGKNRKRWEYYEIMNKILHNKPEITPVATCSSSKGLVTHKLSNTDRSTSETTNTDEECFSDDKIKDTSPYISSFSRKRSAVTNALERRHQDKMRRQDEFLNYFSDYLNILRNKTKDTGEDSSH